MIYLDHNATTPLLPEVFEAMQPWLTQHYANPSSVHRGGRLARQAIDTAREQVADFLGAQASQVIFTSGGTEADNLALRGAGQQRPWLVGSTEHAAVLECAQNYRREGGEVEFLAVSRDGEIGPQQLREHLQKSAKPKKPLVSIMWANNETGVIQDIPQLAEIAVEYGALLHSDAVQAAGKISLNFAATPLHLMSVSAHKLYGPKGVGALLRKSDVSLQAQQLGGGHEHRMRAGTENLPAIVGFGVAAQAAKRELDTRQSHVLALRKRLEVGLAGLPQIQVFATNALRVANTCQFGVQGFHSEALLMELDKRGIAVTSGSACHAGTGRPTHVLLAMGYDEDTAHSAIRVSFGRQNSDQDVDGFLQALQDIIHNPAVAMAPGLFGG